MDGWVRRWVGGVGWWEREREREKEISLPHDPAHFGRSDSTAKL